MDAVSALYGTKTAGEMLPVSEEGENVSLEGMISKPSLLKSSRQYQTIIINRRVVESAVVSKAVDNAYHSLLPKNGYPLMVLSFQVPPESIDVNVHPQKREIKFSDEQGLFRLVYHAVLGTLTSQTAADSIAREMIRDPGHEIVHGGNFKPGDIRVEDHPVGKPDIGLFNKPAASWGEPRTGYNPPPNRPPFLMGEKSHSSETSFTPELSRKEIFSNQSFFPSKTPEEPKMVPTAPETVPLFEIKEESAPVIPLGQVSDCFILCQHGKDLLIIDQHAAHERVRYDRLASRAEGIPVQEILVPYLIHVDSEDIPLLDEHRMDIERLGITFEQAGPDVIRITGAPEDLSESEMERVVSELRKAFHEADMPSPETLRHRMMAYAACRGAIKRGDPLNIRQMKELIVDLFHTTRPFVCPHGRPTIVKFTPDELGRLFKRP